MKNKLGQSMKDIVKPQRRLEAGYSSLDFSIEADTRIKRQRKQKEKVLQKLLRNISDPKDKRWRPGRGPTPIG